MRPWLVLVLAAALAGCGGGKHVPAGIPLDGEGDPLPTVEGFVVDEAIRPLAGVTVRILQEDVATTTDEDGHYALSRPTFLAENVLVTAFAPGYLPLSHQVQASGHTSARIDFRLDPDPRLVPRVEVLQHRGLLTCQVRAAGVAQFCDAPTVDLDTGIAWPDVVSTWAIDTSMHLAGAVLEVHWDAETPLAERLHVVLRGPVVGCCENQALRRDGEVQADVTGPSPIRVELPADAAEAFPAWSALWLEVTLPDGQGPAPASAGREQAFDAFASLFYVEPAPPGYQLS